MLSAAQNDSKTTVVSHIKFTTNISQIVNWKLRVLVAVNHKSIARQV